MDLKSIYFALFLMLSFCKCGHGLKCYYNIKNDTEVLELVTCDDSYATSTEFLLRILFENVTEGSGNQYQCLLIQDPSIRFMFHGCVFDNTKVHASTPRAKTTHLMECSWDACNLQSASTKQYHVPKLLIIFLILVNCFL